MKKSKTNFSNHRRDHSGWALYFYYRLCSFCQRANFMNMLMTSIYASVIIPVLIWVPQFYLQTDQKDSEGRYYSALKKSAPDQIFLSGADSAYLIYSSVFSTVSVLSVSSVTVSFSIVLEKASARGVSVRINASSIS